MLQAKNRGLLESFIVGMNRTKVSLLQFANDLIFFFRASTEDLQNLKLILLVFWENFRA